jgi:hypothetical protein
MAVSGNTLTVTFGTQNGPTRSASGGDTMVWTPSPSSSARDRAQNPASTSPASERGALDEEFSSPVRARHGRLAAGLDREAHGGEAA